MVIEICNSTTEKVEAVGSEFERAIYPQLPSKL